MFGGNNPKSTNASTSVDTLIGRQTEILGDVRFSGGLHIDGKVKGKVIANSDKAAALSISDTGVVEGDVRVPNIVLNGAVIGDVHATEKVTLAAKARVNGNVYYKIIEMEGGATVNGQLVHEGEAGRAPAAALAAPQKSAEEASMDQLSEARRAKGL
ncbi:polymer-forming cytoskeletal protein [Solimonas sp. K1W22B-7]|uniref:bactofilin family protein n=1 Tax=Solimonas sp. K1W22B-7 TaxID=2303331 RepID=UPI000E330974|nr:polymer-forming cytoskeletal protein [Solimonas sp. K1W22B-7]AXQ27440.1 polymer-forming cytoskeletal protein [Solimonas sp. K1W22B-7]